MKIYTKTGDKGTTSLFGGTRVSKDDIRIEAYGTTDELNAWIGVVRDHADDEDSAALSKIQNTLFNIGSILATEKKTSIELPNIEENDIVALERWMDRMSEDLPPLKNFVLPGGDPSVSFCHVARTVCRRAERRVISLSDTAEIPENVVIYLNRLSDLLFILARKLTFSRRAKEVLWKNK
ncbi:MAG: cob(I)yrinic acid a,c-diamide adenosyltransferase [Flavobacteriales bacterium]|nr:cob(I)yrinic acid a,c-diamide adenosyltransferase [Flavobacteriales bacterium]